MSNDYNPLLSFSQDSDEPIILNADGKEFSVKRLRDVQFAVGHLASRLDGKDENVPRSFVHSVLGIMEYAVADLGPVLGYDARLKTEIEDRHAALRQANARIHELERMLGASKPLDGFEEQTQYIAETIKEWWADQGFGSRYFPNFHIHESGVIELTLVFDLEVGSHSSLFQSKDPASRRDRDRQKIASVVSRGYNLIDCGREEFRMRDNDGNKEKLVTVLRERFPSIYVERFVAETDIEKQDLYYIKEIHVYIRNVTDLALPAESECTQDQPDSPS